MADYTKIVGANGNRRKNDFYPTPPECTIALLDFLEDRFLIREHDFIWEPACGNNAMVNTLKNRRYSVVGTDITYGDDYLTMELDSAYDWIITNPPFSLAQEFIVRSISHNRPFALLLKSQYWHSSKRLKIFTQHPPAYVLPLTWRPDFTGEGSSLLDMMWVVWIGEAPVTYYIPLSKPKLGPINHREGDMK